LGGGRRGGRGACAGTGLLGSTLSKAVECAPIELCPALSSATMPHIGVLLAARNERRARYRAVNRKRANACAGTAGS